MWLRTSARVAVLAEGEAVRLSGGGWVVSPGRPRVPSRVPAAAPCCRCSRGATTCVKCRLLLPREAAAGPARPFFVGEATEAVAHTMREETNGRISRSDARGS
jgi:hypothetical protein